MPRKTSDVPRIIVIMAVLVTAMVSMVTLSIYTSLSKVEKKLEDTKKEVDAEKERYNDIHADNTKAARIMLGENRLDAERLKRVEQSLVDGKKLLQDSTAASIAELLEEYRLELDRRRRALDAAKASKETAEGLLESERTAKEAEVRSLTEAKEQIEKELEEIRGQLRRIQQDHRADMEELQTEVEKRRKEWQDKLGEVTEKLNVANKELDTKDLKIKELIAQSSIKDTGEEKVDVKKPYRDEREMVDGRIVEIDNELGLAVIDIGRTKGVKRGLKFNVFRDSGRAGRHLKGQVIVKKVYELVSEVFVSYQRGTGQNFFLSGQFSEPSQEEVVKRIKDSGGTVLLEFSPAVDYLVIGKGHDKDIFHKAQELKMPVVRYHLIESFLASPDKIQTGDIIVNPAFSTTKKEQFYLFGDFATPTALLKDRVREYGSTVTETLDAATDYLVVGAAGFGSEDKNETYKKANQFGVTVMREEELLAFLTD